ncbi:hypothetical protein [Gorillibacterium sp. CAU 1737]|uniref:hypothetical protein n=1 Tax=Gorillibacterium sp. CAU 1737 TaxID=3140362 RepID=UPI0032614F21
MARYLNSIFKADNEPRTAWFDVGASQTINEGDLVVASSGVIVVAAAAATAIVGIAAASITTGASPVAGVDRIPVTLVKDAVIRIDYTGTTKTTLAVADKYGTAFDLGTKRTLNLDDTTGGMLQVIDYNNTNKTADVVILAANQYLK